MCTIRGANPSDPPTPERSSGDLPRPLRNTPHGAGCRLGREFHRGKIRIVSSDSIPNHSAQKLRLGLNRDRTRAVRRCGVVLLKRLNAHSTGPRSRYNSPGFRRHLPPTHKPPPPKSRGLRGSHDRDIFARLPTGFFGLLRRFAHGHNADRQRVNQPDGSEILTTWLFAIPIRAIKR